MKKAVAVTGFCIILVACGGVTAPPLASPEDPVYLPLVWKAWKQLPSIALPDWPRPADDNGLGIHFLANAYYSEEELDRQIERMVSMRMKWALVIYGDEIQLRKAAIKFRDAGITVVWRKMRRPYEPFFELGRDVQILQEVGMPPYMQLYNEPSLPAATRRVQPEQAWWPKKLQGVAILPYAWVRGGRVG